MQVGTLHLYACVHMYMCVDICVAMWYACVTSMQCIGNSSTKVMYYIYLLLICMCVHVSISVADLGGAKEAVAPPS